MHENVHPEGKHAEFGPSHHFWSVCIYILMTDVVYRQSGGEQFDCI